MKYNVTKDGLINAYGEDEWMNTNINGDEPFDINTFQYFKKSIDKGQWISTIVNYQYIIIPTDLIPSLVDSVGLVEDVLTGNEFTVYLSTIGLVTRDGEKKKVKTLPISFTPCTILDWESGDETQLQSIIDSFNAKYDPPRSIDFQCHFTNLQELEDFKSTYCL